MSNHAGKDFIAGLRSDAVSNATGRDWREWFAVLDGAGVEALPEGDIARYLREQQGLSGWWSRMVTTGYAQSKRGAAIPPRSRGPVQLGRAFHAPPAALFKAWADDNERDRWLPGQAIFIRKAVPDRLMRITWSDRISSLSVEFIAEGAAHCRLELRHVNFDGSLSAEALRSFWVAALDRLENLLAENRR